MEATWMSGRSTVLGAPSNALSRLGLGLGLGLGLELGLGLANPNPNPSPNLEQEVVVHEG